MKSLNGVGRRIAPVMLTVLVFAAASVAPAEAQDHDLVMFSFDSNPKPLKRSCSASLSASFLINGHMDDQLSSGDAEIRFYWADGSAPVPTGSGGWNLIGSLSVTWSASDGVFAAGREWPTGFPSVAGTTQSWSVPTSPTSFHLKAEVGYTAAGVVDDAPGNNRVVVPNVASVEGNCGGGTCGTVTPSGIVVWTSCLDPDVFRIPREDFICLVHPERCKPPRLWPPLCSVIDCNPCFRGLTCPPGPWELLIRWPEEVMRFELYARGERIATSEPLRRPIERGGETFHQVIRFTPEKGIDYSVRSLPGPKAEVGKIYPLTIDARQLEKGKSGQ